MSGRRLYIAAYDIRDARRLRRALLALKSYASGRQNSVFECYLSQTEYWQLAQQVREIIDEASDRFLLIRHDAALPTRVLGKAVAPADPDWYYVG